ncbi:hypothetical protein D3C76_986340 [compost metagenome]|jgi:hypothetical protein
MLGEAHHVRYDETMASRLLALAHKLNNEYAGSVGNIVEVSTGRREFEKPLFAFEGMPPGPSKYCPAMADPSLR